MKRFTPVVAILILVAATFAISGCTTKPDSQTNSAPPNANTPTIARTLATGTLTANPNPIKVCDRSGNGETTITWSSMGSTNVEVRVGKPDGDLFGTGPGGIWKTGKWVGNGMKFFLQDVSDGKRLTADNTIATLTVGVTSEGCP